MREMSIGENYKNITPIRSDISRFSRGIVNRRNWMLWATVVIRMRSNDRSCWPVLSNVHLGSDKFKSAAGR